MLSDWFLLQPAYTLAVALASKNKEARQVDLLGFLDSGGWDRTNDLMINSHPLFR